LLYKELALNTWCLEWIFCLEMKGKKDFLKKELIFLVSLRYIDGLVLPINYFYIKQLRIWCIIFCQII